MSNAFDEIFAELDAYYPGSKRKRREPAPARVIDASSWETEFYEKYLPNGKLIKMYTLGSLAKALNRSVKTLRFWIEEGNIPASPYRLPSTTGTNGKVYAGRRLYSKAMVEVTVEIFAKARILTTNRVDWTVHRTLSDKLAEAWETIRAEEMKTN
jgi:hypothetical protein